VCDYGNSFLLCEKPGVLVGGMTPDLTMITFRLWRGLHRGAHEHFKSSKEGIDLAIVTGRHSQSPFIGDKVERGHPDRIDAKGSDIEGSFW